MIRIGVVNIDVSHPKMFSKYLSEGNRARYAAVYNDGFRGKDEVEGFYREAGLEKICNSIEELADFVDIGFIQGCNWDKHLKYAKPFFDRNKPVFIDKPTVGNLKDCGILKSLSKQGKVILGSSSVRYCDEVQEFLAVPAEERGEIVHASCCVGADEFNYAIHAVEGLCGLLGSGAKSVKYVGTGAAGGQRCESYYINFKNGTTAAYDSLIPQFLLFQFVVITTKKSVSFTVDNNKLYGALLDRICDYMETGKNEMASVDELCESIKIMLAGKASKQAGGAEIFLDDLEKYDVSFDGYEFEKGYAAKAAKLYCQEYMR